MSSRATIPSGAATAAARHRSLAVEEAYGAAADRGHELLRRHRPAVALEHGEAAGRHAVRGAVRFETSADAGVRPGERIDRQCPLAVSEGECQGDEQTALEHPDFRDVADYTRSRLP
jgi:hypothetical protein